MSRIPFYSFILAVIFSVPANATAREVSKKEFRKYRGVYTGIYSGTYGLSGSDGFLVVSAVELEGTVTITGRRKDTVTSPTGGVRSIQYTKVTGSGKRVRFRGTYIGNFVNPINGQIEPILGGRTISINDKGKKRDFRFVMKITETLQEGSYSALNVSGVLLKED